MNTLLLTAFRRVNQMVICIEKKVCQLVEAGLVCFLTAGPLESQMINKQNINFL